MAINGNLPPSTNTNPTADYFNNFFKTGFTVSQNIDDTMIGYFQTITGNRESGTTLASAVLYTAQSQGKDR